MDIYLKYITLKDYLSFYRNNKTSINYFEILINLHISNILYRYYMDNSYVYPLEIFDINNKRIFTNNQQNLLILVSGDNDITIRLDKLVKRIY